MTLISRLTGLFGVFLMFVGYYALWRRYRRLWCLLIVEKAGPRLIPASLVSARLRLPLHLTYSILRGLEDDGLLVSSEWPGSRARGDLPVIVYGTTTLGEAFLRGETG